jgi:hypothetical protein
MRRFYGVVLENYAFRIQATGHIPVILETYLPEAFPYFVALMSVAMLKTGIERETIYYK